MPIPLPSYDDRRWPDLLAEAQALIPGLDATWTDFNAHDPGITLLELVAWLVEGEIYRLNRVPDRHVRKFLTLVGRPPRPPIAARVAAGLNPPASGLPVLPAGVEFMASALDGSTCRLCASHSLKPVLPSLSAALVQAAVSSLPVDHTADLTRAGALAPLGASPAPGAALWLGFGAGTSAPLTAGATLRLHFEFLSGRSGLDERRGIIAERDAQRLACRPPGISSSCESTEGTAASKSAAQVTAAPLTHHDAQTAWDYYGPAGWTALDPVDGQVRDDTRALTLDGSVTIVLPGPTQAQTVAGHSAPYWLRVRLAAGVLDAPPVVSRVLVNAIELEQAVPSVGVHVIAAGAQVTGAPLKVPGPARLLLKYSDDDMIASLAFDQDTTAPEFTVLGYRPATTANAGLLVLDLVLLGRSNETPDQQFALRGAPVQGHSVEVYTLESSSAGGPLVWRTWKTHADFDAAQRNSRWASIDEVAGVAQFGNGNRGLIPPLLSSVLARWNMTVGAAGNVAVGALSGLAPSLRNWLLLDTHIASPAQRFAAANRDAIQGADPATAWLDVAPAGFRTLAAPLAPPAIVQPSAAVGGTDAEDVVAAAGAAIVAFGKPTRAITSDDYLDLTLQTPGTIIARADVVAGTCPSLPGLQAPGVVTVIVVPRSPPQPTPSVGLLEAVRRYLDRRRMVGTFPAVCGPSYLIVSVIAQVQSANGAQRSRVLVDVTAALNAFLDPLTGGPVAAQASLALAQTTAAATNSAGAVTAIGLSAATPIPGVQLLAATPLAVTQAVQAPPLAPGWPFGRSVYRAEVLQVIQSVAGVDHVESLELSADGAAPSCGNLFVAPLQLVAPGSHSITIL